MVKSQKNYASGKIYVIRNHCNSIVYVGSTTQPLYKRFSKHKGQINCERSKDISLYKAIKELGVENFYIELIENYPCNTQEELTAREGHFIRQYDSFNNGYNKKVEGRSKKEWYNDNRDRHLEKFKDNYEKNKETFNKKSKEYYEKNKDAILQQQKEKYEENKEEILKKQAEYRNANRELIRQRDNERRAKNKDELNKKRRESKITCVCGHTYSMPNHSYHLKSKKHLDYINNKN